MLLPNSSSHIKEKKICILSNLLSQDQLTYLNPLLSITECYVYGSPVRLQDKHGKY